MITYLVSGDEDIEPTRDILRGTGREVQWGAEVEVLAADALARDGRFVVVAHGDEMGTIYWANGVEEPRREWVWVGMHPAPRGSRVYFYCCKAGPEIARFLRGCDCLGHGDVVPMPVDENLPVVIDFLDQVDRVMDVEEFEAFSSRLELADFVSASLDRELDTPSSLRAPCLWLMLSRSLRLDA